jgi:hypothetical protein
MDGKIEQQVCIKFCMTLVNSLTETLDMLREAYEHSSSRFEWHSRFKAGRVSVEADERSARPSASRVIVNVEKRNSRIYNCTLNRDLSLNTHVVVNVSCHLFLFFFFLVHSCMQGALPPSHTRRRATPLTQTQVIEDPLLTGAISLFPAQVSWLVKHKSLTSGP